ncbi:MAG: hypothetical protein BA863_16400 [Desulfovibrio sp. S3730MH75]|nr:MAG: hypothetical protein BA863_16400 [Desulfovibrio sp. S3730MH75]
MTFPRPFVDYYSKNAISPVSQDISNVQKHFEMRNSLYRTLGIPSRMIEGRTVIEFGPGSGYNSLFTHSLSPEKYLLVEANPTGIATIAKLFADVKNTDNITIAESLIEDFAISDRFDFVFCEGVIPAQRNPVSFLKHIASFATPGGVVVITCVDNVSALSEMLRRFVSQYIVDPDCSIQENAKKLAPIWKDHLDSLEGMTRPHEDWILDNMLQPFYGPWLSIKEAIEGLEDNFCVYNSSPSFFADWRWFKDNHGDKIKNINQLSVNEYEKNVHNLLDYRAEYLPRNSQKNKEMLDVCLKIHTVVESYMRSRDDKYVDSIMKLTIDLGRSLEDLDCDYNGVFEDFRTAFSQIISGNRNVDFGRFTSFFGRGQQYLSFIRDGVF